MSNVITRDNGDIIGFYPDLRVEVKNIVEAYSKSEQWEEVKDMADLLLDLNGWADNENLLVISDNNGMGYTIKEYKKGD